MSKATGKKLDYPFKDCAAEAERLVNEKGATIFQKWSCANCGSRQTMAEPNVFYTSGRCEECGHVTDITKTGCNYLAMFGNVSVDIIETLKPTGEPN